MKVLIAIASHEYQHYAGVRSCYKIKTQEGDRYIEEWRWRGDVAREAFVGTFLDMEEYGDDDALLMLDADQRHPNDLLEKLRAHDLDMVCAHYYRRGTSPVQSLCYELTGDGTWPYLPYLYPPTEGLHEIATTGFGCVLIKKKVFKAVQAALPNGMSPVAIGTLPDLANDHANWGPDYRFFYLARKAGYKLMLDASIESLHSTVVWMGHKAASLFTDYAAWANAAQEILEARMELHKVSLEAFKQRYRILEARKRGFLQEFQKIEMENSRQEVKDEKLQQTTVALHQMDGRLLECQAWIEWWEKYPPIVNTGQLPTNENTPKQETIPDEVPDEKEAQEIRQEVYRDNAVEMAEMLPDAEGQ